jgi:hypothetical protein
MLLSISHRGEEERHSEGPMRRKKESNLLERLTELRMMLYLHLPLYYKGCNSGTVK